MLHVLPSFLPNEQQIITYQNKASTVIQEFRFQLFWDFSSTHFKNADKNTSSYGDLFLIELMAGRFSSLNTGNKSTCFFLLWISLLFFGELDVFYFLFFYDHAVRVSHFSVLLRSTTIDRVRDCLRDLEWNILYTLPICLPEFCLYFFLEILKMIHQF